MRQRLLYLGLGILALTIAGCSGPSMAAVRGKITCKGKPVANAFVQFSPESRHEKDDRPGKGGTANTDSEGNYVLSTYRPYDGAHIGKHHIIISLDDGNPAKCPRTTEVKREVVAGSNEFNIDLAEETKSK